MTNKQHGNSVPTNDINAVELCCKGCHTLYTLEMVSAFDCLVPCPPLPGDSFYEFRCNRCAPASFFNTLPKSWLQVLKIVLFNLNVLNGRDFHSLADVYRFMNKYWDRLFSDGRTKDKNWQRTICDTLNAHDGALFRSNVNGSGFWSLATDSKPTSTTAPLTKKRKKRAGDEIDSEDSPLKKKLRYVVGKPCNVDIEATKTPTVLPLPAAVTNLKHAPIVAVHDLEEAHTDGSSSPYHDEYSALSEARSTVSHESPDSDSDKDLSEKEEESDAMSDDPTYDNTVQCAVPISCPPRGIKAKSIPVSLPTKNSKETTALVAPVEFSITFNPSNGLHISFKELVCPGCGKNFTCMKGRQGHTAKCEPYMKWKEHEVKKYLAKRKLPTAESYYKTEKNKRPKKRRKKKHVSSQSSSRTEYTLRPRQSGVSSSRVRSRYRLRSQPTPAYSSDEDLSKTEFDPLPVPSHGHRLRKRKPKKGSESCDFAQLEIQLEVAKLMAELTDDASQQRSPSPSSCSRTSPSSSEKEEQPEPLKEEHQATLNAIHKIRLCLQDALQFEFDGDIVKETDKFCSAIMKGLRH